MSEKRFHHPFSPSQLGALEACPCYESQQASSPAAEKGTRQHTVAETGDDDATLSDEEAAAAAAAMEFVAQHKKLLEEARTREVNCTLALLGCTVAEAESAIQSVLELRETYLPIDDEDTTAGTADNVLVSHDRKHAILVDFKFGRWGVQHARENRQSDAYALSIFHAYPTVESVAVHFFQPAVTTENTTTWTRADVPELLLRIKIIVARAKAAREARDFSTANPSTPTCLFCKHLAVCPAVAEKVISVAKKFAPLLVPSDLTPTRVSEPAEAACGLRLATLVEAWAKAFRSLATDRALRTGVFPDGYELTSRATREIVDPAKFKQIASEYLTSEEIESTIEIGMTKIEKLLAQKAPRGMKTATVEAFQAETEQAGAIQKKQPFAFLKQKPS